MTAMKQPEPSSPDSPPSDAPSAPQPPPRSRNAKAQARHRAKRKAYIEQLEQTVSRLQAALAVPPEQLGGAHARLHELEQENLRLRTEVELLRAQLGVPNSPVDAVRRGALGFGNSTSDLPGAREGKRRRLSADTVDPNMYLASALFPTISPLPAPVSGRQRRRRHGRCRHLMLPAPARLPILPRVVNS